MKAIALDDEPLALELIETFSSRFANIESVKTFSNTAAAFKHLERNAVDLLFLDINMPATNGIDFYKSLHYKPLLILTTSYSEFALEGYEINAVDYLLKPFTFNRFEKAVLKAYHVFNLVNKATTAEDSKYLMLKVDYGIVKVVLNDILFIEGLDNYLKIHLQNQAPLVVRLTMKSLMEKLNENEFLRVHKSYIVPVNKVTSLKQKVIQIGDEEIPVSKNYEEQVKIILNHH